jgi:hypothetical protein
MSFRLLCEGWASAKWAPATAKAQFEHAVSKAFGDGSPVSGLGTPTDWAVSTRALWALDGVLVLHVDGATKAGDIKLMKQLLSRV